MKNENWKRIMIPIDSLSLWDENARFPDEYFEKSETDLIKYFCTENNEGEKGKRDFKIIELAEAIVKDFDLPQLEKLIVYCSDNKNIVLEGNRRLTAYKLLSDPNSGPNTIFKNKFKELKSRININAKFELECLTTGNKLEGLRYIDRKHANNNFEVSWGEQERTNHKVRRGIANKKELFKVSIAKIIKSLNIPGKMKEQILGPGYITTFWRIIDSSPSWKKYEFNQNEKYDLLIKYKDFNDELKVIILNVLQNIDFAGNKVDSRSLNKNKDIEKYLFSIKKGDYEKVKSEIENKTKVNLFNQTVTDVTETGKIIINPKSTDRQHLIPKTCRLDIQEKKINNIYRELRDDLILAEVPNAVGVLFRVFLETSIDHFADQKKINLIYPGDNPMKLKEKIKTVASFMEKKGIATKQQLLNIRTVATNKGSILSIESFHRYVHSYKYLPDPEDLKTKWDNLEDFFEILWKS